MGERKKQKTINSSYCPYCMGILDRKLKHNIKCPFCHHQIYFRPEQVIYDNFLLKKEDAIAVDYLKVLNKFNLTEADFLQEREELIQEFGMEITSLDVIWSLYKRVILNSKDLMILKMVYRSLALFLKELGNSYHSLSERSAKMQLLEYQNDGFIKKVRIVASGPKVCPACQKQAGNVYSIDEALQVMPIPCQECSCKITKDLTGFCQCTYAVEQ